MRPFRLSSVAQVFACALVLAPWPAAQDQNAKRPVTHADVWLMKRLGTPSVSPDGTRAVFSVSEPSYEADGSVSDLWVVPTDGSAPPRRLTSTAGGEGSVVWSPDGRSIAFTAKRGDDQKSQCYVLDMTGPGEARRVTDHAAGVAHPQWSPNGTMLAFESVVEASAPRVEKESDVSASAYEAFPIRYWDRWLDDRQVHLFVQPVDDPAAARDLLADCDLVRAAGFAATSGRGQDSLQAVWSPGGDELLFVATTERDRAARAPVRYRIWRVGLDGGQPEPLAEPADASDSSPEFSADGTRLVWRREPLTEHVYNHSHVMAQAWPDGAAARIATGLDRPIGDLAWQGDRYWLVATEHGRGRVFAATLGAGEAPRLLDADSRGVHAGLACGANGVLVSRWEDSTHPAEIVRIDAQTGALTPLTAFNVERAAQLDRQPFREFWFDTEGGRRIHAWLVLPPAFDPDQRYPLLTWMHGGPHSSSMDMDHVRWSPHLLAAPGYVVIMADYTGSVGYGEAFAQAIQGDPLETPANDLLQAARAAAEAFSFVDADRQAALGASYGGHLANWMLATTDHFRCLVGHAGLVSLEGQWATSDVIYHRERNNGGPPWGDSAIWHRQSPSTYAAKFVTPILLTVGEKDYRVPLNQTIAAWSYVQRQAVPGRLLVFHQANHWIMRGADARYFWREVHDWLGRHLE